MKIIHSTFSLERHYPASIEKVFGAWADPEARRRWMAQGADHSLNFSVGGRERVKGSDEHGRALVYEAHYVDIVTNERILTTSTMHTDEELSTVSVTSVEFQAEGSGTLVVLTEHGMYLPGQERPEWREAGTSQQLDALAHELRATSQPEEN